ncbi:MAG: DUF4276 family protein [Actinobacteria bacterium]|nr:DUF4276 family protein [Actinomycetota bacterium]
MSEFRLALIVEGHGELAATPILVRRIAELVDPTRFPNPYNPFRVSRGSIVKSGELERYVELAARRVAPRGAVLLLLDADKDCAATLGPQLLVRARSKRPTVPIGVCLAVREFESWFLAAAESLAGKRALPDDLRSPEDPESIGGAKEWLQFKRTDGRAYSATIDQPALANDFDLAAARAKAPSFDKFWREVERLMGETSEL